MTTLWSAGSTGSLMRTVFGFGASFAYESPPVRRRWGHRQHRLGRSACERGPISEDDGRAMVSGTPGLREEGRRDSTFVNGRTRTSTRLSSGFFVERIGEPGRGSHGASRENEQVALDLRLYRGAAFPWCRRVWPRRAACASQANRPAGPSCRPTRISGARSPSSSHTTGWRTRRHSAATTRGRCRARRGGRAHPRSGAVVGTAYAIDVHALPHVSACRASCRNSLDAASDRDFVASFLHASALSLIHLSRLAEDLVSSARGVRLVELDDRVATGSRA